MILNGQYFYGILFFERVLDLIYDNKEGIGHNIKSDNL